MNIVILIGISGAGKSTYAKTLPRPIIVSADDFFMVGGEYKFDPSKLDAAHGRCLAAFIETAREYGGRTLESEPTLVVDNTNTTLAEIAPYYAIARAYGHQVRIVKFICDPHVAAARNRHGVPLETCKRQNRNIENLALPPFWQASFTVVSPKAEKAEV